MKHGHPVDLSLRQIAALAAIGVREWVGYYGAFTRNTAPNAIPSGTRIRKIKNETGETRPVGSTGVVLGSVNAGPMGVMYFIEWDDQPKIAIATIAWKIEEAT